MEEIYKDICRINAIDPATPELRFCKLSEEFGELAQAVNKKLGRKVVSESDQEVLDSILEESADTVQCVISYLDGIGITYESHNGLLTGNWMKKDEIYSEEEHSPEELIMWIEVRKGNLAENGLKKEKGPVSPLINDWLSKSSGDGVSIIRSVMALAGIYGFTPGQVIDKIFEKNVKWEKVATERTNDKK